MKVFFGIILVIAVATFARSQELKIGTPLSINGTLVIYGEDESTPYAEDLGANLRAAGYCVDAHNAARSRNGKGRLTVNNRLVAAAQRHNQVMAQRNCFSHQCSGEPALGSRVSNQGYTWRSVGENLAKGHRDCQHAVNGWMNSPGHRANILGNFRHIGCHKNGSYYTCVFGTPR